VKAKLLEFQFQGCLRVTAVRASENSIRFVPENWYSFPKLVNQRRKLYSLQPDRQAMSLRKKRTEHLSRAVTYQSARNTGLPKGRESYGNGVPVVVRGWESQPHGEGEQITR